MNESVRAYIYRVLLALVPLLAGYGLVDDNKAALFVAFVTAVFGTGLAVRNTSTSSNNP
jgi:hypothetical protein